MVNRASEGMIVRHGESANALRRRPDALMATLDEYLGYVERVDKRIRNEKLTELLAAPSWCIARFRIAGESDVPPKLARLHEDLKNWPTSSVQGE